jgi:ribosomal protein S18 acetylase RimI-like enzyme
LVHFQSCVGKDITLHVSANNPAVMLYQNFGFKVEERILNFYEKYLPADSQECKHALFLRLTR